MLQATVAVVEAMAGSWQRACDGEGEVPAIEGGGEGSGERRRADGVVMAGCEGGGGDVADVMMAKEASTRVAVVTVVVEGAEPGVGGRRRPSRVGPQKGAVVVVRGGRSKNFIIFIFDFFWSHTIGLAEICRLRPLD